jgi:hypothetical protein
VVDSGPPPDAGPQPQPIGGTVTGLGTAAGLVLQLNGANDLPINGDGGFTFPTAADLLPNASYAVTISTQPTGKTCTISAASGTVANGPVTSVVVNCAGGTFTVGGAVTGLANGDTVVLTNNGTEDVTVNSNNTFAFPTAVGTGSSYAVTVKTQPTAPAQTCVVTNGTGTVASANVTNVAVACTTASFPVSVTVQGLAGGGSVVLQNNLGDNLTVSSNSTTPFATKLASGAAYSVTVLTNPTSPAQTCTVTSGGSGTVGSAPPAAAVVNCTTPTYKVGGSVSGLNAGGTLVLTDSVGAEDATVTANGSFSFPTSRNSGTTYNATIKTQPAGQTCSIAAGGGTVGAADVTSIVVNCAAGNYTISGKVTNLFGTLQLTDGTDSSGALNSTTGADTPFAFPALAQGMAYAVNVTQQPAYTVAGGKNQTCSVTNGTGSLNGANVTNVGVACVTNNFKVQGRVNGLASGSNVTLHDAASGAASDVVVSGNGSLTDEFTFPITVPSGTNYTVSVTDTDPGNAGNTSGGIEQLCSVSSNGPGVIQNGDVINVVIDCSVVTHQVSVNVSGLATNSNVQFQLTRTATAISPTPGSGGSPTLTVTANGVQSFNFPVASGQNWAAAITAQPQFSGAGGANQTCTITPPTTGTIDRSDVTLAVTCVTNFFLVNANVQGLNNGGGTNSVSVRLQSPTSTGSPASFPTPQVAGNDVTRNANGLFNFGPDCNPASGTCTMKVKSGEKYYLSVSVQPNAPPQTCIFASPNACISTTTGLLLNNGADCTGGGLAACTGAGGTCTGVTNVVGNNDTSPTTINCTTNAYFVGGTNITNLKGALTLHNTVTGAAGNGPAESSDANLSNGQTGPYTFPNLVTSGNSYSVAVSTQPVFHLTGPTVDGVNQTCTPANPTGTIVNASVNNIDVSCVTNKFHVAVNVTMAAAAATPLKLSDGQGGCLLVSNSVSGAVFQTGGACNGGNNDIASGNTYGLSITTPPGNVDQNCVISVGNTGAATGFYKDNNETLTVTCTRKVSTITAHVFGLNSTSVSLQNNGGDTQTLNGASVPAGSLLTFATTIPNGSAFAVTVSSQPTVDQWCTVVGDPASGNYNDGTGTVPVNNTPATINVNVYCGVTCRGIHNSRPGDPSGVFSVDGDGNGPSAPSNAYCDMATAGGGWTLALKADSSTVPLSDHFKYEGDMWTTVFAADQNLVGTMLDVNAGAGWSRSFATVAFNSVRLQNKTSAVADVTVTAASDKNLNNRFVTNTTYTSTVGRAAWLAFVPTGGIQAFCNAEGFNVNNPDGLAWGHVRIGILGNENGVGDCTSPDSALGVGLGDITSCAVPGTPPWSTSGNQDSCDATNHNVNQNIFVWVR